MWHVGYFIYHEDEAGSPVKLLIFSDSHLLCLSFPGLLLQDYYSRKGGGKTLRLFHLWQPGSDGHLSFSVGADWLHGSEKAASEMKREMAEFSFFLTFNLYIFTYLLLEMRSPVSSFKSGILCICYVNSPAETILLQNTVFSSKIHNLSLWLLKFWAF